MFFNYWHLLSRFGLGSRATPFLLIREFAEHSRTKYNVNNFTVTAAQLYEKSHLKRLAVGE